MLNDLSTRRVFLQKGLTLLAACGTVPTFISNTTWAMANPLDTHRTQGDSGKDGPILVVVQLSGGNDGLNTVIPFQDDAYYRARPNIAIARDQVLRVDDTIGLHPNLAPLKALYDDGMMSVVQGVGYPNPNRSHFRSMDIWHSAQPERDLPTSGWLGRFFDNTCTGAQPYEAGVSMGDSLPLAMQGEKVMPLSFDRPENYRYTGPDPQTYLRLNTPPEHASARPTPARNARPSAEDELAFLQRTAMDAQVSSDRILSITRALPRGNYPSNSFGNGLRTIAAMIRGGLPTRVYYVSLGGFDTHANQRGPHDRLMQQFAQGVSAFWSDMKDQGNAQRVLMMTFSEFGRRVAANASAGTDHGAAAPMFLFGPSVRQGVVGNHPSLTDLDRGDLKHAIDFRSVYASILQHWLKTPSKPILGQQFRLLDVVKA